MDGAKAWATLLGEALHVPKEVEPSSEAQSSSDEKEKASKAASPEEARALLQQLAMRGQSIDDVTVEDAGDCEASAEAALLGHDLWEALLWRRGALRYYVCAVMARKATADTQGEKEGAKEASTLAKEAAFVDCEVAAASVEDLFALLAVRCAVRTRKAPPRTVRFSFFFF